jgi:flagellar hook-associated protein 3 FlgL
MLDSVNSTSGFYQRALAQMTSLRSEAEKAQLQIATGERLQRPSDDPVASARLRALDRAERLADVNASNAGRAREELGASDNRLSEISNNLLRVRELAVQAASGTVSESGREAIAAEIASLRGNILSSANAVSNNGRSLFGGDGPAPAYAIDPGGTASYAGTAATSGLEIAEGVSVERGVTGPQVFEFADNGSVTDVFAFLNDLEIGIRSAGAPGPAEFARASLDGLDAAIETVTRGQTVIGVRLAWIDSIEQAETFRSEARAQEGADVGGVDIAAAITQMQQVLTALEASQASFTRLSSISLFDNI